MTASASGYEPVTAFGSVSETLPGFLEAGQRIAGRYTPSETGITSILPGPIGMDERSRQRTDGLYETDFYSWTQQQAALLKEGRLASADIENIVEELETLGRSELGALVSAYKLITQHLLKLTYQPDKATLSWTNTIKRERGRIHDLLDDNPGLKPKRDAAFAKGYARGRREAASETEIAVATFPAKPPFSREEAETRALPQVSLPADDKSRSRG